MKLEMLEQIGLTKGEIRVYIALLELGESTKTPIATNSGVSPGKIYDVLERLTKKGLVSVIKKGSVKHFRVANPHHLQKYLDEKKMALEKEEGIVKSLLPQLLATYEAKQTTTDAEVYKGWNGMSTVYADLLDTLQPGDEFFIFGASKGVDEERVKTFYTRFNKRVLAKKLKANIIFNEEARNNIPEAAKTGTVRYLQQTTPSEIVVYGRKTAIVLLEKEPLVILIRGESIATSFKAYFDALWQIAKE
jgi:sugar-specific transcriptional regulator TrmB